jgi:DNA modification methylase
MAPQITVVENLKLEALQLDAKNPRVHSKRQVRRIARSIEVFGFNVPVLINAEGRLIAGHGRVLAARLLGLKDVPAIRLQHLTEAQARAFMIADNRLTENSTWDERLLAEQFQALSALNVDFDVEVTGFEMAQVDATIESVLPVSRGKDDPADATSEHETKTQVTRAGDCWILDRHRVYCGDARIGSGYSLLMKSRRAEMVFTDPPFNDPIDRYITGFGKLHHPEFAMAPGEMNAHEFTDSLAGVLMNLARSSTNGSLHYICMDWRHAGELLGTAKSIYSEFKNLCVWVKENAGQGSLYRSQHEFIFVFKNGKNAHRDNMQRGQYGRYRTNVWHYSRVKSITGITGESDLSSTHPTIKPVELVADAILDCTARGDIVLDPFLGIGTTVISAERTGRICYGMELDRVCVDMVIRRWQAFTGQSAIQESTGRTFSELEEEDHEREK